MSWLTELVTTSMAREPVAIVSADASVWDGDDTESSSWRSEVNGQAPDNGIRASIC